MSKALALDRAIDAFIEGSMEFTRFRQVVEEQLARHPESTPAVLKRLEALGKVGRLSPALHALISEEIVRSSQGDITATFDDEPESPAPAPAAAPTHREPRKATPPRTIPGRPPVLTKTPRKPPPPAPSPPVVGAVLGGRYRLEALLERGGMSRVFRAVDERRSVAGAPPARVGLKAVHPEFAGPSARLALEREASLLAELSHPGVVRMLGFDVEGDTAFMVMELLDGERLRSRLVRCHPAPLPAEEAMGIIRELAEALAYLHGRGLAHRDVKPANVFVTASGSVRLIDFGLAATVGRSDSPGAEPPKGWTPLYASPDMLAGAPPDPRDDVYSLGCVAYEMLTGRHPWGNISGDEAAHRKLRATRPAGLPRDRWAVLRHALAFRAADRPPDAAAFLAAFFPAARPRRILPWVAAALLAGVAAGIALVNVAPGPRVPGPGPVPPSTVSPPVAAPRVESPPDEQAQERAALPDAPRPAEAPVVLEEPLDVEVPTVEDDAGTVAEQAESPASRPPEGPRALSLAANRFRIEEAGGALRLELARPAGYEGALSVLWRTVNGSASDGEEFVGSPTWRWAGAPAGAQSLVIFIPIVDDSRPGPDLTFQVELRQMDDGPEVGQPARAEITVVDDD